MRSALTIIAVLIGALAALEAATGDAGHQPSSAAQRTAPVPVIARRVEELRDLRFRRQPRPVRVSPDQARDEGLADLDRGYPPARRRADEALYTLLGLLPAGTDLRDVSASIFGEQVAGYYDPRNGRLRIVDGAGTANRVLDEMVLAHELTHALEDQHFELDVDRAEDSGDAGLAYQALAEGTASAVMNEYLVRHFEGDEAIAGLLGGAFAGGSGASLPPFIMESLIFPYVGGEEFATWLYRRAGGRWTLVDLALERRPPASTEQVLHPRAWLAVEMPERVRVERIGRTLGAGWDRLAAGTFGEWQTGQLLALGGRARPGAAAGWGGDRYELWRQDAGEECETPCTGRDALVMRWRWDTAADAREFAGALRPALDETADARDGAAAAVVHTGLQSTLAVAPDAGLAQRLARLR